MTWDTGEVASRFLHYTAATLLFGTLWFFFREIPLEHSAEGSRVRRRVGIWQTAMVLFAIASGLAWFAFTTARISQNLSAALELEALSAVLRETDFGPLWALRIFLALILFAQVLPAAPSDALKVALSAVLLGSLAMTGHARSEDGVIGAVHVFADALHLLAAGLWLGGLFGLLILLTGAAARTDKTISIRALRGFAGTGSVAVAILIASGALNTFLVVGGPVGLVSTSYGRILLCKIAIFVGMLALAGVNRFKLIPRLGESDPQGSSALASLKRNVLIEQVAGLGVLAIVSVLGTSSPPV